MYIIYGQPNCVWCKRALELTEGAYDYKDITIPNNMKDFQREFPGAKTVPKIHLIDDWGNTIGKYQSYEELVEHFNA